MKSFSTNLTFVIDFKQYVPSIMYKTNTHNISGVRKEVNNPDCRIVMTNDVYMYVVDSRMVNCITVTDYSEYYLAV